MRVTAIGADVAGQPLMLVVVTVTARSGTTTDRVVALSTRDGSPRCSLSMTLLFVQNRVELVAVIVGTVGAG